VQKLDETNLDELANSICRHPWHIERRRCGAKDYDRTGWLFANGEVLLEEVVDMKVWAADVDFLSFEN
jgi:hypothetical protein